MRALLDSDFLIAFVDKDHVHHVQARTWLTAHLDQGWASCAVTQNACIRIMSLPFYSNRKSPKDVATAIQATCGTPDHLYWTDEISLSDPTLFDLTGVNSKDLTDIYLLGLATFHGGRLVTFDQGITTAAVLNARPHNLVIL